MTKTTAFVTHSDCSRHDPGWKHPEHQGRLPALARAVHRDMLTLFEPLLEVEGRLATVAELELGHTRAHIERVREAAGAAEAAGESLELDGVMLSGASWDAARAAAGCVLTAIDVVRSGEARNAFCAVRPPGGGARADRAADFGLFNHVAIGALYLQRRWAAGVLIVELGALPNHGIGEILDGQRGIRRVALRQEDPERETDGVAGRIMSLGEGSEGAVAEAALVELLAAGLEGFDPDFVLLALGFDALAEDPLGKLHLSAEDYHRLTLRLRELAEDRCDGRLVSVLEGGYAPGPSGLAAVQHLRALASLPPA